MNKVILMDRDGVVNYDSLNYIKSEDEFILIGAHVAAIARLNKAGYKIGMATNQSGVTRGLYSEATLLDIHQKMQRELGKAGAHIDAIEYCIHLPDAGCPCRKPQPGMLMALGHKLGVSLEGVFFVGDRITDIEAAQAAGATPVIILSPMTDQALLKQYLEVPVYQSLGDFVDDVLKAND